MKELDVKRRFRKEYEGWVGAFEIAIGGDTGAPDMMVLVGRKHALLPLELKRGVVAKFGNRTVIQPDKVRPAQVAWHNLFREAGGRSALLIGTLTHFYVVNAKHIARWRQGFTLDEAHALAPRIENDLTYWCEREWGRDWL